MADKLLYLCIVLITSTTISNTECPPETGTVKPHQFIS